MKTPKRLTSTDRARAYEQRLRASGGAVVKIRLRAAHAAILARLQGSGQSKQSVIERLLERESE